MQQKMYTSCIKVNGIPLLPPLMTDSIKEEMRLYKSLAIKVEEKLKSKQLAKHAKDKCVQADIAESVDSLKNSKYSSDSDISNHNTMSDNTYNSDSFSKMTIVEHMQANQMAQETRNEPSTQSSASDLQHSHFQVSSNNVINDLPITEGIYQTEYINETETAATNVDVMPESCKSEVPKTLDIVPLTLNQEVDHVQFLTTVSKENENLPKLSRQGSYVLDTPSPCLLAHMDTDCIDKDYIPTPTTNVLQRTQWNTVSPKVEWQSKRFIAESTKDALNKFEHAKHEVTSEQLEASASSESYQTSKSSSIVAPEKHLTKKCTSESDITQVKHSQMINIDVRKQDSPKKSREDNSIHVSHSAAYLQEFMENTSSSETQSPRIDENKCYNDEIENDRQLQDLIVKTKSSTIPEKLLIVYKQIEEMHKKQILELISRQRKEQSLLQTEFQKQQMILLAEIRKCSLGIVPYQADAISNATTNQLSSDESRLQDSDTREQLNVNSSSNLQEANLRKFCNSKLSSGNHADVICPLDYISPKNFHLFKSHASSPLITEVSLAALNLDAIRKVNSYDVMHNNNNNSNDYNSNCESHDYSVRKNFTVNRQLFPLDSNTIHVPVLDTSAYLDKHIRAVNTINAYTRGYLVRRLMRTERVITLKKIYKEALQCMLKLHVDAPLNLAEVNFLHRLQLQCDAASMNLVELFAQSPTKRMKVIAQDREIKQSRTERPSSSRSYSFATQKTLARKTLKEFESTMTKYQRPALVIRKNIVRSRCQTWTSDIRDRLMSPNTLRQGIRRSTSAGTVRKPWR